MEEFRCLNMCDECPLEKNPNGKCYEGIWSYNEFNVLIFSGVWKCVHYDYNTNTCNCQY